VDYRKQLLSTPGRRSSARRLGCAVVHEVLESQHSGDPLLKRKRRGAYRADFSDALRHDVDHRTSPKFSVRFARTSCWHTAQQLQPIAFCKTRLRLNVSASHVHAGADQCVSTGEEALQCQKSPADVSVVRSVTHLRPSRHW